MALNIPQLGISRVSDVAKTMGLTSFLKIIRKAKFPLMKILNNYVTFVEVLKYYRYWV